MAYTYVATLDNALAALNGARQALRPEFCCISERDRRVYFENYGYGIREINSAITVTWRAVQTVNRALDDDPNLRLVEDHKGRWVAIRNI